MDEIRHIIDYRNRLGFVRRLARIRELALLAAGSPGYYLLGMIVRLWTSIAPAPQSKSRRIVVLGFGGIGNHLTLMPALSAIRKDAADSYIHLVTTSRVCADLFREHTDIDAVTVMDIGHMTGWREFIRAGRKLKSIQPDTVMASAGTRPTAGGLIAFFSGAHQRVGEDWKGRGALYTQTCRANAKVSELQQNLRLAEHVTGGSGRTGNPPVLRPHPDARKRALQKLAECGIGEETFVMGIHPGSGDGQKWKRWRIDHFIRLVHRIVKQPNVKVIFFLGPDESDLKAVIEQSRIPETMVYCGQDSIWNTAALIECCRLFLSNDSGLRHMAVALGVPTIGIFGPTSVTKNDEGGAGHLIIRMEHVLCRPCHYTPWWLACGESMPCLETITVDHVWHQIKERMKI